MTLKLGHAMIRSIVFASLALAAAFPAAAAPRLEAASMPGLTVRLSEASGARVHGSVCRSGPQPATGPVSIHAEHLNAQGGAVETADFALPTALGPRDRACAYYDLPAAWRVGEHDAVRVCADRRGQLSCAARVGAD